MEMTISKMKPIPVEYVLAVAQTKGTDAKRRPYIELIERWGEEQGQDEEARQLLKRLREGQVLDPKKMPREFMPRFRQPEIAEKLIEIVRKIDDIYKPTVNRFDAIICAMIPGKGRDTVRKHGDYEYIMGQEEPWPAWTSQSYINPTLAAERSICNQIALEFAPVLTRTIRAEL